METDIKTKVSTTLCGWIDKAYSVVHQEITDFVWSASLRATPADVFASYMLLLYDTTAI